MTLSHLAITLGAAVAVPQIYGLSNPKGFAETMRKLPRNIPLGFLLMGLATAWFLANLHDESIADFESMKKPMMIAFGALGIGTCVFVQDFLPVRGGAILMFLLGKLMVDTARWHDSPWHLLITAWAYVLVVLGVWFTVSPWRVRDILNWFTATEQRIKVGCSVRLAFAILVLTLGLTVY